MEHLPIRSVVMIVVIDVVLMFALSGACGVMVARGAGRPAWRGVLLGVLLPVVGPFVWALVVVSRRRQLLAVRRVPVGWRCGGAASVLVLAGALYLVGM